MLQENLTIFNLHCRMIFGYAYPAYECYKSVELNKPDIEQLRFWCQYWYTKHSDSIYGLSILFSVIRCDFIFNFAGS